MTTYVVLLLPPPNGRGYTRRLLNTRGPRGTIVCGTAEGQAVRFKSAAVLRFLDKEQQPPEEPSDDNGDPELKGGAE